MGGKTYTREEAQAILGRALEAQVKEERLSHDELLATAREVGVSPEALEAAARAVEGEAKRDAAQKQVRADAVRGLASHALSFVAVNALLVFINVWTGGPFWAMWPLLGWGLGLVIHAFSTMLRSPEAVAREAKRREERRAEHDERRRLRERRRASASELKKSALELERVALKGVSEILSATARGIEEARRESEAPAPKVRVNDAKKTRVEAVAVGEEEADEGEEEREAEKRARR